MSDVAAARSGAVLWPWLLRRASVALESTGDDEDDGEDDGPACAARDEELEVDVRRGAGAADASMAGRASMGGGRITGPEGGVDEGDECMLSFWKCYVQGGEEGLGSRGRRGARRIVSVGPGVGGVGWP